MPKPKPSMPVARHVDRARDVLDMLAAYVARDYPASELDRDEADMLLRDAHRALSTIMDQCHLSADYAQLRACDANVIAAARHLHAAHNGAGRGPDGEDWEMLAEALLARSATVDAYLLRRYRNEQLDETTKEM